MLFALPDRLCSGCAEFGSVSSLRQCSPAFPLSIVGSLLDRVQSLASNVHLYPQGIRILKGISTERPIDSSMCADGGTTASLQETYRLLTSSVTVCWIRMLQRQQDAACFLWDEGGSRFLQPALSRGATRRWIDWRRSCSHNRLSRLFLGAPRTVVPHVRGGFPRRGPREQDPGEPLAQ